MKEQIGKRLRDLRTGIHLSQVELAKALHVTKQSVSNWENDNIQPSIEMLLKIAEFFSVSTDYLLARDEGKYLDVSDLSDVVVTHLRQLIEDLRTK